MLQWYPPSIQSSSSHHRGSSSILNFPTASSSRIVCNYLQYFVSVLVLPWETQMSFLQIVFLLAFLGTLCWSSNTFATWCKELTHWKRPSRWERLKAGGEADNRERDGWMAPLTQWTWVRASSRRWWWTGKPGMLQHMGLQSVGQNWATELNLMYLIVHLMLCGLKCILSDIKVVISYSEFAFYFYPFFYSSVVCLTNLVVLFWHI